MILRILNHGDLCSLTGVVLILLFLGSTVTHPRERSWGAAAAVAAFVLYALYGVIAFRPPNAEALFLLALRSLAISGLVLGLSWTVSPLAALFTPVWQGWRARIRLQEEAAQRRRAEHAARRREADERDAWERSAPEREHAAREAEKFAKAQARAQKRRQEARAACEMLYALHAPEIASRFGQEAFNGYVHCHLGDEHSLEYVERRARQLQEIIRQHLQKVEPEPSPSAASDRQDARAAVHTCYADHAELLREVFPLVRFNAELRVRIPDSVTPEEAWKEARDMIHEILELAAGERERQKRVQPRHPINPPMHNI